MLIGISGCIGPGPRLPASAHPLAVSDATPDQPRVAHFDMDDDGAPDFDAILATDGTVTALRFDPDSERPTRRAWPPTSAKRELLIIIDSVPYDLVAQRYRDADVRWFRAPQPVISVFPALTDPALAEFTGTSPCPGPESTYYNGRRLEVGWWNYATAENMPWLASMDYTLRTDLHAWAYSYPRLWMWQEIAGIQRCFHWSRKPRISSYMVTGSAMGVHFGLAGHAELLDAIDRLCLRLIYESRGDIRITLMSDHGHDEYVSEHVSLASVLRNKGYRVGATLSDERDVVIPEWGVVTSASVSTRNPAGVARDLVSTPAVELAAYRDGDSVRIVSRSGAAQIERRGDRYRYTATQGDPLELTGIVAELAAASAMDAEGFADSAAWFRATWDHAFPDPCDRLWKAFDGLFTTTPDVFLSIAHGFRVGDAAISADVPNLALHGALRRISSTGMVITTSGGPAGPIRMRDLSSALR